MQKRILIKKNIPCKKCGRKDKDHYAKNMCRVCYLKAWRSKKRLSK